MYPGFFEQIGQPGSISIERGVHGRVSDSVIAGLGAFDAALPLLAVAVAGGLHS